MIMGGKQVGTLGIYHDVSDLLRFWKSAQDEQALNLRQVGQAVVAAEVVNAVLSPDENIEVEDVGVSGEAETVLEQDRDSEAVESGPKPVQMKKRMVPILKIEGIGPVYAQKLAEIGVKYTDDLLELGKSRKGRQDLVEKTGISATLVLKWVNMADLMRVHGIGEEYSELLEKAGVDTVKELRNRNPNNLFEAMTKANEVHQLVRRTPHLSEVENWVKEAKELPPILEY
jgi:predicted flap endonuclease-1-like 5' DNA nuclease